ncbi:MAG TPA: hypothetical protein VKO86_08540 [Gemmatimonadales bacterium]|nr:hypothetical protein [Gemmatimonadales bacterium]
MAFKGWARCLDSVADILRRGAWYPIVEETAEHVVLDVHEKRIRLSRADLQVRLTPPDHWSIVVRTGVLRPTLGGDRKSVTQTYAVCPSCNERQEFTGKPTSLRCTRCRNEATVDWSVTC